MGYFVLAHRVVQQNHELVTAHAGHGVGFSDQSLQLARDQLQHFIADVVPQGVVDALEPVQVQKQHRQLARLAFAQGNQLVEALHQQMPVWQVGQAIVQGQMARMFVLLPALGDVTEHRHVAQGLVVNAANQGDALPRHENIPVFVAIPYLALPAPVRGSVGPQRRKKARIVRRCFQKTLGLSYGLGCGVTGDLRESRVHRQDDAVRIGDHDAFDGAAEDAGSQLEFHL